MICGSCTIRCAYNVIDTIEICNYRVSAVFDRSCAEFAVLEAGARTWSCCESVGVVVQSGERAGIHCAAYDAVGSVQALPSCSEGYAEGSCCGCGEAQGVGPCYKECVEYGGYHALGCHSLGLWGDSGSCECGGSNARALHTLVCWDLELGQLSE